MNLNTRAKKIRKTLCERYPHVKTQLAHRNPFELLVATILSAQCTDKQVNQVTETLFKTLNTPEDFANARLQTIESLVYATGFYKNKARNIQQCSRQLLDRFGGQVPDTLEALVSLTGVGRKTANVVLGQAFGRSGIVVDTHVARLARRLGLTDHQNPVKIEFDLMALIPETQWSRFSLQLVYFGREICTARQPKCPACPLAHVCPYPEKTHAR